MTPIKGILLASILGLLIWAFRYRSRVGMRAGIKLGGILLAGIGVAAVVDPGLTQTLANAVGVTRGTDLMLYLLVIVFAFTQAGSYFRFRDFEIRFAKYVRAAALSEAVARDGLPGVLSPGDKAALVDRQSEGRAGPYSQSE